MEKNPADGSKKTNLGIFWGFAIAIVFIATLALEEDKVFPHYVGDAMMAELNIETFAKIKGAVPDEVVDLARSNPKQLTVEMIKTAAQNSFDACLGMTSADRNAHLLECSMAADYIDPQTGKVRQ